MADGQDSGSCARKGVEVQVLSRSIRNPRKFYAFEDFFVWMGIGFDLKELLLTLNCLRAIVGLGVLSPVIQLQ